MECSACPMLKLLLGVLEGYEVLEVYRKCLFEMDRQWRENTACPIEDSPGDDSPGGVG
jgi:hypothetical protein